MIGGNEIGAVVRMASPTGTNPGWWKIRRRRPLRSGDLLERQNVLNHGGDRRGFSGTSTAFDLKILSHSHRHQLARPIL